MSDVKKRYYRKHVDFFRLLEKIKLWPSRSGVLHGIRSIRIQGNYAEVTTHCGHCFMVRNSKNSRAVRWLRNKWVGETCRKCKVPNWKIGKYSSTYFTEHYGSDLKSEASSFK